MNEINAQHRINLQALPACVQQFVNYFENLDPNSIDGLDSFYAVNVHFQDPVHEISGLDSLKAYFNKLNKNLNAGSFSFVSVDTVTNKCFLQWEMTLSLKKPRKTVRVNGISVLTFEDKITIHRDYFDLGEMIYEHIPLVGGLVRFIKKKIIE